MHMAPLQAMQFGNLQHHLLSLKLRLARIGRQSRPRLAEHHPSGTTLKQAGIQGQLELGNLSAHC
nr:hypothetical protein GCM10020185_86300 [Pseudomonas brassicacearum subsp. brassicacearum]